MSMINVEFSINSGSLEWFEEYCEDAMLDIHEEMNAIADAFLDEQISDVDREVFVSFEEDVIEEDIDLLEETDEFVDAQ
ncbi:hypothetical protein MJH12_14555 [bacterium]|nr:hypothetical protein [bacterium]